MVLRRADEVDDGKISQTVVPLADRQEVHGFIWAASVFCVTVAIWTGLRIWSRRLRKAGLTLEDYLYYVAVAGFYGFVVALFIGLYLGGAGHHISELNSSHMARLTQGLLMCQVLYGLAMCCAKWSMLFVLKRIFAVRKFELITWSIIGLQAAWLVMTVLIGFLICRPITKNWDPTVEGVCGNRQAGYTAVSVVNVIVDIAMLILPLPMVLKMQLKKGYKIGVLAIFSVGITTIVFSVARLVSLKSIDWDDFPYTVVTTMLWTTAETGITIMVASSVLLRPAFHVLFRRVLSLSGSRTPGPSKNSVGSQPKSRMRREFVEVGDSTDRLELGTMGQYSTEVSSGDDGSGQHELRSPVIYVTREVIQQKQQGRA